MFCCYAYRCATTDVRSHALILHPYAYKERKREEKKPIHLVLATYRKEEKKT